MLINQAPGAPVTWTIGARGERPDEWPARLVTAPTFGQDDRGNHGLVATIITRQTNLQDEPFYGERTVQVRYLFDRAETVEALDGTDERPLSVRELIALRQQSVKGYLGSRGAGQNIGALMTNAQAALAAQVPAQVAGTASQTGPSDQPATASSATDAEQAPKKPAK